jgi:peptidoglycan/xylan/chitin deacetylase (PgdA/CDA1 family)
MLLKALAEDLIPDSALVLRGREGRRKPLASLRGELLGKRPRTVPGRVALTFDDGPTSLTPKLLEVLAKLDVRGTFFVIGELCAARPDLVRAIADAGHELASHGYTHRRFTALSRRELETELSRTRELLPRPSTSRPLVRPPYGSISPYSLLICAQRGFTTVLWSLNSHDWRLQDAGAVARTTLTQHATPGEILLFHEGQAWTLDALPAIVGGLRQAGHELVTVGELLA